MTVSASIVLDGTDTYRPTAIPYDGGITGSVRSAIDGSDDWVVMSADPRALRRLAAALTEAADKADKLRIAA